MATRSSSAVGDVIWIAPAKIVHKIAPVTGLNGNISGEWDIRRRYRFAETIKFRSIVQRYTEGRAWEDTDLFTDAYARRMKQDGHIGGIRSLPELARQYAERFDTMIESMKRDGFRLKSPKGKPYALPSFLIGRDGEVMIGNQGNHRLAIAQLIGLDAIAGKVVCKHSSPTSRLSRR